MLGPYTANKDGTISYKGNEIFKPISNINSVKVPLEEFENRVEQFDKDEMWEHIARINHTINLTSNEYFNKLGALFTALPMTTRMISSPGAVYGKEAINYTTDTCPITLEWFNLKRKAFLSESSQIYLELALMQKDIERVYSIYNSFRKEKADATHLSEFHHIEYEGKVSQEENEMIALNLIKEIIKNLLKNNYKDFIYKRQGDKRINDYCIEILKKSKLDISKKIHEEIFTKYKEYLKLFNKNLQYCGYSIIIFQKRRFKDESELFLSREVSLNER